MATVNLTPALVEKAKGPTELRDKKVPGLICRVRSTGRKTFEVVLKERGVRWQKKLGAWPHMTVSMAREQALAQLTAERAALPTARGDRVVGSLTLREFAEQYFSRTVLRSEAETRRVLGLDRDELKAKGRKADNFTWAPLLDKPLREIRRGDIEELRAKWHRAGAAPSTVNRKSTVLRGVLTSAVEGHDLLAHPMEGLKDVPEVNDGDVRVLTEAERGRLYGVIDKGDCDLALGTAIYILMRTGIRMGELSGLRPADVDRRTNMITIRATTSKVAKTRRVPIDAVLAERLALHARWARPTRKQWNTIMKRARIEGFIPKQTRHDFCSRLANKGVPMHVVQKLAGHSTIVTTGKYYVHAADDALRAAVEHV